MFLVKWNVIFKIYVNILSDLCTPDISLSKLEILYFTFIWLLIPTYLNISICGIFKPQSDLWSLSQKYLSSNEDCFDCLPNSNYPDTSWLFFQDATTTTTPLSIWSNHNTWWPGEVLKRAGVHVWGAVWLLCRWLNLLNLWNLWRLFFHHIFMLVLPVIVSYNIVNINKNHFMILIWNICLLWIRINSL